MDITTRYTLEDWRTQDINVHHIPEPVLNLPFDEVLKKAFGEIGSLDLNPVELVFSCIFLHNGWRVVRMPMGQNSPGQKHISVGIERVTEVNNGLRGSGVPDLFLWKSDGQHRFVEIKASENSLNKNQREWAKTYDWNFFIAQLAPVSEELSDEEVIERNRIT